MSDLRVTRMLSAHYYWQCAHGKYRDKRCRACERATRFNMRYRPKHFAQQHGGGQ